MITIYDASLRAVNRSQNLRGILDYTRTHTVDRLDLWPKNDKCQVGITWANGSSTCFDFASFTVCKRFFESRKQFGAPVIHN